MYAFVMPDLIRYPDINALDPGSVGAGDMLPMKESVKIREICGFISLLRGTNFV